MVTIYKNTKTNKLYALNELITMGNKICLVPFDKSDDIFISPSTLKRWYTKWDTAEVLVEVKAFTGMKICLAKVTHYSKTDCTVLTRNGKIINFDLATEKQTNATKPKFANRLGQVYGSFIPYWLSKDREDKNV